MKNMMTNEEKRMIAAGARLGIVKEAARENRTMANEIRVSNALEAYRDAEWAYREMVANQPMVAYGKR